MPQYTQFRPKLSSWYHLRGPSDELVMPVTKWLAIDLITYEACRQPEDDCDYDSPVSAELARQLAGDIRSAWGLLTDEEGADPDEWFPFPGPKGKAFLRRLVAFLEAGPFEYTRFWPD